MEKGLPQELAKQLNLADEVTYQLEQQISGQAVSHQANPQADRVIY